jgi:Fungal Zn(2)-Cys(6) binuclear cluster domain
LEKHSSCTLCRSRKIRCDRGTPCSNCLKSRNGTCIYEDPPPKAPRQQRGPTREPPTPQYPTPSSTISRDSTIPNHLPVALIASSTAPSKLGRRPITRDVESLESRIRQLEEELAKVSWKSTQSPISTLDSNEKTTGPRLGETGIMYKTRMFGQSHWMNGIFLVSLFRSNNCQDTVK